MQRAKHAWLKEKCLRLVENQIQWKVWGSSDSQLQEFTFHTKHIYTNSENMQTKK